MAATVTDSEIATVEGRVMMQLERELGTVVHSIDTAARTQATERVAHLARALLALRQARGGVSS